jgi:hypothetical protein
MFLREPVLDILGGRERRVGGKLDPTELTAGVHSWTKHYDL